jgi:hypothetical protein
MAGRVRRIGRVAAAVAPWVLACAAVTVTFGESLAAQGLPFQSVAPTPPLPPPPEPQRPAEPKTPRVVTFEPWEQVPS